MLPPRRCVVASPIPALPAGNHEQVKGTSFDTDRAAAGRRRICAGFWRASAPSASSSRDGRSVARAQRSFGEMLDTVRPVAESFVGRFRGLANAPDEITPEFGVSLSAEADVVIASIATAANFSVTLTWNRSNDPETTVNSS
ncbi:CU044_2847 family protein [Streptomyces sp. NPDC055036]